MTLFQDKYKIDSQRLKNWDYSSEAIYFITLVAQDRECIFGSVINDRMILNDVGQIVENEILKSIKIRENWFFHNWIVMPNHIHLLIEIQKKDEILKISDIVETQIVETHGSASTSGTSTRIGANVAETHCRAPLQIHDLNKKASQCANLNQSQLLTRKSKSISSFVAIFKSVTTKQINDLYREAEKNNSASVTGILTKIKASTTKKNTNQSILLTEKVWQSNYHDHIVRNYKRFETIYRYIKRNPRSWETDSINSNFQ